MKYENITYIYQHLGLGDNVICNGLIRLLCNRNPNLDFFLFVRTEYVPCVARMYSDVENLDFVPILNDNVVTQYLSLTTNIPPDSNSPKPPVVVIGFGTFSRYGIFENDFYGKFGYSIDHKWDSFKYIRDESAEVELANKLEAHGDYIFVHDDCRFAINKHLPEGIRIIKPTYGITNNIFDYAKIIEDAKEVHCIESSFTFMIDQMNLNKNFYAHRYARKLCAYETPKYRNVSRIFWE